MRIPPAVPRLKPTLKSLHDGALEPGMFGWPGPHAGLPNDSASRQPCFTGLPRTFLCCPEWQGDAGELRTCTACGRLFCPECCPVAAVTGDPAAGAPCPHCGAAAVHLGSHAPAALTRSPHLGRF